jgi:hypothetical protein
MKKFIICLGLGKNQLNLIKEVDKSFGIIGIDMKYPENAKKKIDIFFKGSLYRLDDIIKISQIIKKKYNVTFILYRSSGPTILAAHYLEKYFNIKRINKSLSRSIYSKSYFFRYLKSIKLLGLKSSSIKKLNKFENTVIKPDAPIYGKKNIYLLKKKKINSLFKKCQKESHNEKVNISNFYDGADISSFYLSEKGSKNINLISHTQEFNYFKQNTIRSFGICSPPLFKKKIILNKKELLDKSIIKTFKDFYGIISISSKILKNNIIYPYEINIGLSGDKFADLIFPFNFNNRSLYKIELDMCLYKRKIKIINNKRFIGLFNGKKITSNNSFEKKIDNINK